MTKKRKRERKREGRSGGGGRGEVPGGSGWNVGKLVILEVCHTV